MNIRWIYCYFCLHNSSIMQIKSAGIILHTLKYSDSATIVTAFTHEFGRVSYMVYGINKKKAACRAAILQPLSLVEIDASHLPSKKLQSIKDIRISYQATGIPYDPLKNAIALFIAEMLFRTLRETEPNEYLYAFLENSIQTLDCCEDGLANFHLVFLLKLSKFLGFEPNKDEENARYFDLMNGVFTSNAPQHSHYIKPDATPDFEALLRCDFTNMNQMVLSRQQRIKLLEALIEYFRLHIPNFQGVNSLEVLQALFD